MSLKLRDDILAIGALTTGQGKIPAQWETLWFDAVADGGRNFITWLRTSHDQAREKLPENEHAEQRNEAILDLRQTQAVLRFHQILRKVDVEPLFFKGFPLAHEVYPAPYLRPRSDVDVLIPLEAVRSVRDILGAHGFRQPLYSGDNDLMCQGPFIWQDEQGFSTTFDVHWDITVRKAWSQYFEYPVLMRQSRALRTWPQLRTLSRAHQYIVTLMHPFLHHQGQLDLFWGLDLLLMSQQMQPQDWRDLMTLSLQLDIESLVSWSLACIQQMEHPDAPRAELRELNRTVADLILPKSRWSLFKEDLSALPRFSARLRHLQLIFFPSVAYMAKKYGVQQEEITTTRLLRLHGRRIWNAARFSRD